MKLSTLKNSSLYKFAAVIITVFTSLNSFSQQAWTRVPSPDPSPTRNMIRDIGGTSSSDVWMVGSFENTLQKDINLLMHWNGSGWQVFPNTDLSITLNDLWSVTAITPNDVWAAGAQNNFANTRSQLLHWNGTAWSHTLLPDITGGSFLFSIDAISTNDIWAVGTQSGSPTDPAYAIHYNGSSWTEFPVPNAGSYSNRLYAVDGISPNDVWAVGRKSDSYGDFHAMAQHWNGSSWTNSSLPASVVSPLGELEEVTMISSNDVWALGSTITGGMLMIHWDGTTWSEVPTAGSSGGAIVSRGPDVFSVGNRISQWNGTNWTVIDSINQITDPSLGSAVSFSNGDIWASGNTYDGIFHTLVYRTVNGLSTLPVLISNYSMIKTGATATMQWSTSLEINAREFVMERSADGVSFIAINRIAARGSGYNYDLVDPSPLPGWNYYRLQLVDMDGRVTTFPVKRLNFDSRELKPFVVYPNPVVGSVVNLRLNAEGGGMLFLYNQRGQQVMSRAVSGPVSSILLNLPESLAQGVYILSLVKDKTVWSEKIFIR